MADETNSDPGCGIDEESRRRECWQRFKAATAAAKQNDFSLGNAIIRDVRERHGKAQADIAKRELERYLESGK